MEAIQMLQIETKNVECRRNDLEHENELLFDQLIVVQEELERLVSIGQDKYLGATAQARVWGNDALTEAYSEIIRLQVALEVRKFIHTSELYSANAKQCGILIRDVTSPSALLKLPLKLYRLWRESKQSMSTCALAGKGFVNVINEYLAGGFAAVELLLDSSMVSDSMKANALTALARSLIHTEPDAAAEAALWAFTLEPRPFRQKWLAFRLHDCGQIIHADAMLGDLPDNLLFSNSETRLANKIRSEAKESRLQEAKKNMGNSLSYKQFSIGLPIRKKS